MPYVSFLGEVYIAIELCDKGSLHSFLIKNRKGWTVTTDSGTSPYDNVNEDELVKLGISAYI